MPIVRPYDDDDNRDPLSGFSDSNADQPDAPAEPRETPTPDREVTRAPEPYTPPPPASHDSGDAPPAPRTFSEMESAGQARPPMPTAETGNGPAPVGTGAKAPNIPSTAPGTTPIDVAAPMVDGLTEYTQPPITETLMPMLGVPAGTGGYYTPTDPITEYAKPAGVPAGKLDDYGGIGTATMAPGGQSMETGGGYVPQGQPANAAADAPPSSSNPILDLLTGGAMGTNQSPVQQATNQKLLDQLHSSSPYDSKAVRDEYDYLAGNIDDQFAQDTRNLDEGMAARGLYGSAGKDFHSGRLSDLNVGKRSAKTALAQDLANKFATTKGQYDANAISQGQAGAAQGNADQMNWLRSLMGYGNDAFNNDLATAEFQQRQNESEQDYMLRLLQLGYGV